MSEEEVDAIFNTELAKFVVSEDDLCHTLNIERRTLDKLRSQGFPCCYLNRVTRFYLVDESVNWIREYSSNKGTRSQNKPINKKRED